MTLNRPPGVPLRPNWRVAARPHSPSYTAAASPLWALATRSRFRFRRQVGSGSGAPLPRPGAAAAATAATALAACFVSTSSYGRKRRRAEVVTHFRRVRARGEWQLRGGS